ncbi:MAG TPA: hypothetical protein VK155_01030 [Bacteroidales bacterium]|nr:hypothetical protein [Bacteroidales bacterium]
MRTTFFISITIFSLIFAAGCKKSTSPLNDQQMLFQVDYVNYAWGFQHNGFIIDGEGYILTYDNPGNWNFADANFVLTEGQVVENLQYCTKSGKVPVEELAKFSAFTESISLSKISALKNTGNDEGTLQFICYKTSGAGNYKGTLVRMEGDFTCENLNFHSRKVASWLREINTSLHSK